MASSAMYLLTKGGEVIGRSVETPKGWRFLPNTSAHQPSRRYWPSAVACIPKWAFEMGDELISAEEWRRRKLRALPA